MFKFIRKPKSKADDDQGPLRIDILGGLAGHPVQVLSFTNDLGRRVIVRGGLPDLLEGEAEGQQRITRGTGAIPDDEYLAAPVAIAAED